MDRIRVVVCGANVKKLKGMSKLLVLFISNGTIKVKILENDRAKSITHAEDVSRHRS